jgi:hypothetical protein
MNRNIWTFYSTKEQSSRGSYWSLPDFPKIEAQTDDQEIEIVFGDRVEALALKHYGDVHLWWIIMVRNELSDPMMDLTPGLTLMLPSLRYVRSQLQQ